MKTFKRILFILLAFIITYILAFFVLPIITIKAETPGEVILEGQSFLKLSGEYLVAKDLYFKNGYTPDEAVIIFRNSPDSIAFNCRVTGTVIEEFTQPDRHRKDHWIEFYGKHNELDHSYIAGKSNEGPTLKVYLNGNEHVNNYHKYTFKILKLTSNPQNQNLHRLYM